MRIWTLCCVIAISGTWWVLERNDTSAERSVRLSAKWPRRILKLSIFLRWALVQNQHQNQHSKDTKDHTCLNRASSSGVGGITTRSPWFRTLLRDAAVQNPHKENTEGQNHLDLVNSSTEGINRWRNRGNHQNHPEMRCTGCITFCSMTCSQDPTREAQDSTREAQDPTREAQDPTREAHTQADILRSTRSHRNL